MCTRDEWCKKSLKNKRSLRYSHGNVEFAAVYSIVWRGKMAGEQQFHDWAMEKKVHLGKEKGPTSKEIIRHGIDEFVPAETCKVTSGEFAGAHLKIGNCCD